MMETSVIEKVASLAAKALQAKFEAGPGFAVRRGEDWLQWGPAKVNPKDQDRWQFTYESQDADLRALCDVRLDRKFMVAVYQVTLMNVSQTEALALSQLACASIKFRDFGDPQVFSCSGGGNEAGWSMTREYPADSFRPKWISPMYPRGVHLSSGRATWRGSGSSSKNLPIFMLSGGTEGDDLGMFFGLEWSTCWEAWVNYDGGADRVQVLMGPDTEQVTLEGGERLNWGYWANPIRQSRLTKLVLEGGQSVELPAVHVGFFEGGFEGGTNACRRYIHQCLMPRYQGKETLPPVAYTLWGGIGAPYTDKELRPHAAAAAQMGVEMFCVDADWYTGTFEAGLGNWEVDPQKFPDGMEAFAEYVQSKGMGLGLYFDGAAKPGTRLVREHPEFFYNIPPDDYAYNRCLKYNFGNPEACDYWIKMMGRFIERYDLRYIRFEITGEDPVANFTWDMVDPKGRAQFAHVKGLYRVSETLIGRYPNLMLELNSGGGNAIDFGTMKRHYCGWGNDNSGHPHACHNMQLGGNQFLPPHFIGLSIGAGKGGKAGGLDSSFSDLSFLSRMAGELLLHGRVADWPAEVAQRAKHWIGVYKKIRPLLVKDYYRLLPPPQSADDWDVGQFCDGSREGVLFVFRVRGRRERQALFLRALEAGKEYSFTDEATSVEEVISGQELLARGFCVEMQPNSAKLYSYYAL